MKRRKANQIGHPYEVPSINHVTEGNLEGKKEVPGR
jgi:hypothetical protein